MSIEFNNKPKNEDLRDAFAQHKLLLDPDTEYGGINQKDLFGYHVYDGKHRAEANYLQILVGPLGWNAYVPQDDRGMHTLQILADVINRDLKNYKLKSINNVSGQYQVFFPYLLNSN